MIKYKHYARILSQYPKIRTQVSSSCLGGEIVFVTDYPHGFSVGDTIKLSSYPLNGISAGFYNATSIINSTAFKLGIACSSPLFEYGIAQSFNILDFEELNPLGFKSIVWEFEDGEIFSRRKIPDELTFTNEHNLGVFDFDFFYNIEQASVIYSFRCDEIQYYIEKSCDNGLTYDPFWYGYLAVNDGKFDLDRCIYKTKIKVDDEYRCLIENGDKEINLLQATPSISVPADYSPTFEFIDCGCKVMATGGVDTWLGCPYPILQGVGMPSGVPVFVNQDCITSGQGWQIYTNTYDDVIVGASTVCSIWVRETNTTFNIGGSPNPPLGSGWINIGSTTIGGSPATNWARQPYNGAYTTYNWSVNLGTCLITGQLDLPLTNITTYDTTGRLMEDVVNFASSESCVGFSGMRSDFFEIDPPGDTPGYVAGINYVTGATNRLNLLAFIQKSDFLNPTATTKAVKGILTFNDLMKVFKELFQAYWFIENGQIRIEHISWFTQTQAFDLTTATYLKFINGKNKYEYIKASMPKEENWKWTEAGNIDFLGLPIIYDSACVDQGLIKNTTIQNVVTDIQWISTHASGSSNEGFVLVATELNGSDYDVLSEVGLISGLSLPNNHLSLANLLYNYFRHNRVLLEGTMNNNVETFFSAIKTKKQVPVSFPFCCDDELIPEQSTIETELGTGYIESDVKLDIKTNMITMELLYD